MRYKIIFTGLNDEVSSHDQLLEVDTEETSLDQPSDVAAMKDSVPTSEENQPCQSDGSTDVAVTITEVVPHSDQEELNVAKV